MDSDNSTTDPFLTIQTLNPITGNVVQRSPQSTIHIQELSSSNSGLIPNSNVTTLGRYMLEDIIDRVLSLSLILRLHKK